VKPVNPVNPALQAPREAGEAEPHTTSVAVWDVPSPVVMNCRLKVKVGVTCSATCRPLRCRGHGCSVPHRRRNATCRQAPTRRNACERDERRPGGDGPVPFCMARSHPGIRAG